MTVQSSKDLDARWKRRFFVFVFVFVFVFSEITTMMIDSNFDRGNTEIRADGDERRC